MPWFWKRDTLCVLLTAVYPVLNIMPVLRVLSDFFLNKRLNEWIKVTRKQSREMYMIFWFFQCWNSSSLSLAALTHSAVATIPHPACSEPCTHSVPWRQSSSFSAPRPPGALIDGCITQEKYCWGLTGQITPICSVDGSGLFRPGEMEKTDLKLTNARKAVAVQRAAGGAVGASQGRGRGDSW